ncbi:type II toxin-antitoxin system VapC family toxin [Endothiovibrio diazotrophicus]
MILVDTSVWIDFFLDRDTPAAAALEAMIHDGEHLALCGVVLTEILQGIRDERAYGLTRERLEPLIRLPMPEPVFLRAADIYRSLRKRGITIRRSPRSPSRTTCACCTTTAISSRLRSGVV